MMSQKKMTVDFKMALKSLKRKTISFDQHNRNFLLENVMDDRGPNYSGGC